MRVEESWKQFLWKLIEDPPAQIVTLNILSSVFIKFLSGNVITLGLVTELTSTTATNQQYWSPRQFQK